MFLKAFWTLFTDQNSLWGRICTTKYKGDRTWWNVEPSPANSTTINVLLPAREKIIQNFTMQIRSGEGIRAVGEPWHAAWRNNISGASSSLSVADLWDPQTQTWKERELAVILDTQGINVVKGLAGVTRQGTALPDRLIWTGMKNGKYSVKWGYQMLYQMEAGGSNTTVHNYWNVIWELEVLPRVKVFLWKVGQNALPVMAVLQRRISIISPLCQICGSENESIWHMPE
jgi:zinc-binding in reverse transcriptase